MKTRPATINPLTRPIPDEVHWGFDLASGLALLTLVGYERAGQFARETLASVPENTGFAELDRDRAELVALLDRLENDFLAGVDGEGGGL